MAGLTWRQKTVITNGCWQPDANSPWHENGMWLKLTKHRQALHWTQVSSRILSLPWNPMVWPRPLYGVLWFYFTVRLRHTEWVLAWVFPWISDSLLGAEAAGKTSLYLHRKTVPKWDKIIKLCFSSLSDWNIPVPLAFHPTPKSYVLGLCCSSLITEQKL